MVNGGVIERNLLGCYGLRYSVNNHRCYECDCTGCAFGAERKMAKFRVLYWHQIPSVVEASDDLGNRCKEQLSARFQELIDSIAMRKKLVGTDAYLEGWRRSRPKERDGRAVEVAKAVAAELEATFDDIAQAARHT